MASKKRFIDAELFSDEWFVDLEPKYKLAWIFLITNCGHDGIWKVSQKLLSFNVGENVELVGLRRALNKRIVEIEDGRMWFFPQFIKFQYGDNLSLKNPTLKQFWEANAKYNLINYLEAPMQAPLEELYRGAKDKVKDKDKVKEEPERTAYFLKAFPEDFQLDGKFVTEWKDWVLLNDERQTELTPMTVRKQIAYLKTLPIKEATDLLNQAVTNQWRGLKYDRPKFKKPEQSTEINEVNIIGKGKREITRI